MSMHLWIAALTALAGGALAGCGTLASSLSSMSCGPNDENYQPVAENEFGRKVVATFEATRAKLQTLAAQPTLPAALEARSSANDCIDQARRVHGLGSRGCDGKEWTYDIAHETVPTSEGTLTVKAVLERCQANLEQVHKTPVRACGFKIVSVSQLSLGGGAWSAPQFSSEPAFVAWDCKEMPRQHELGPIGDLAGWVLERCQGSLLTSGETDWRMTPLDSGQISRSIGAKCWFEGVLPSGEWGQYK